MCSTSFSNNLLVAMAASLAFLSIVRALTIDNQLQVIKNGKYLFQIYWYIGNV